MKKTIAVFIALTCLITFVCLVGCQPDNRSPQEKAADSASTLVETKLEGKNLTKYKIEGLKYHEQYDKYTYTLKATILSSDDMVDDLTRIIVAGSINDTITDCIYDILKEADVHLAVSFYTEAGRLIALSFDGKLE